MYLQRDKKHPYKKRYVIAFVSVTTLLVLGLWALQIKTMIAGISISDIAQSAQESREGIQEATNFAQEFQDANIPSSFPELLSDLQKSTQDGLKERETMQSIAAAMINDLDEENRTRTQEAFAQELNQALEETYVEEK